MDNFGAKLAVTAALLDLDLQQQDSSGLIDGVLVRGNLGVGTTSVNGPLNRGYRW